METPIRIVDLDRDNLMAKKMICVDGGYPTRKEMTERGFNYGFNDCVAQNDRLTIEIDEDKMAKSILKLWNKFDRMNVVISSEEEAMMQAKHLKSTIKTWAKIGVEK